MNKQQNLRDIIPNNLELEKFINDYGKREVLGTNFIPTEVFIKQEIKDVTEHLENRELFGVYVHLDSSQVAQPFIHAICATKTFEVLTRGQDITVGQIIDSAKVECELSNKINRQKGHPISVPVNNEFEDICCVWINMGVIFAYYIQYLHKKMNNQEMNFDKFRFLIVNNNGDGNTITIGNNNNIDNNTPINNG